MMQPEDQISISFSLPLPFLFPLSTSITALIIPTLMWGQLEKDIVPSPPQTSQLGLTFDCWWQEFEVFFHGADDKSITCPLQKTPLAL